LQGQSPEGAWTDRDSRYRELHDKVRAEQQEIQQAYAECRAHLDDGQISRGLSICYEMLTRYPGNPIFLAMKQALEERNRRTQLDYVNSVVERAEEIADLKARVAYIQEAIEHYPADYQLQELLRNARDRRDLIDNITTSAHNAEHRGEFIEALERWRIVEELHPLYPNLRSEIERIQFRLQRYMADERKRQFRERVIWALEVGQYAAAAQESATALREFPGDHELTNLERLVQETAERAAEVDELLARGRECVATGRLDEAVDALRSAREINPLNETVRHFLGIALAEKGLSVVEANWRAAELLLREALALAPEDPTAKHLASRFAESERQDWIDQCLARIRDLSLKNESESALREVEEGLRRYPDDSRLLIEHDELLAQLGRRRSRLSDTEAAMSRSPEAKSEALPETRIPGPENLRLRKLQNKSIAQVLDILRNVRVRIRVAFPLLRRFLKSSPTSSTAASPHLPIGAKIDHIHFSVTAPDSLAAGESVEVHFWAHLARQRHAVIQRAARAMAISTEKVLMKSEGPFAVARGATITVDLSVSGLDSPQSSKTVMWTGEIGSAIFVVSVPRDVVPGGHPGCIRIRVDGVEVARLDFVLLIRNASRKMKTVKATIKRHKRAFASYASEDRDQVLARVQGIQKAAPRLDVFLDVVKLRSGQYWEEELWKAIPASDIFYLFWSHNAAVSEWVGKEWRCAYKAKGLDFIDPVPLEGPDKAPPPPELAAKHFFDPLLPFMNS